jgi:hypothetical protein
MDAEKNQTPLPPRPEDHPRLAPHHRTDPEKQIERTEDSRRRQSEHMEKFNRLTDPKVRP